MAAGCHDAGRARLDPIGARAGELGDPIRRFDPSDPRERNAAEDPLSFLKMCQERQAVRIKDYRCRFIKRERLDGRLSPTQEIAVLFRKDPFSVDMRWLVNPRGARRITYVAGRWRDADGADLAVIEPSGLARLFVSRVKRGIHAPQVRAHSRRSIDCFGFENTLRLIIKHCEMARRDPDYRLRFLGVGQWPKRPCYVFERRLPRTSQDGAFPDRLLIVYVDQEWLVPTATFLYADEDGQELLGSYLIRDIEWNVGLTDDDFANE